MDRRFVSKGWGWEDWLFNEEGQFGGKILFIKQGKKFSYHYHRFKNEGFYVISGKLHVATCQLRRDDTGDLAEIGLINSNRDLPMAEIFIPGMPMLARNKMQTYVLEQGNILHIPPYTAHVAYAVLDTYIAEFSTYFDDEDSERIIKGD